MRLTVRRAEFLDALSVVSGVLRRRTVCEEHGYIKLAASPLYVVLSASNGELFTFAELRPLSVAEEGVCYVEAERFREAIRSLEGSELEIVSNGKVCFLREPGIEYELFVRDFERFPETPEVDNRHWAIVDSRGFADNLAQTLPSVRRSLYGEGSNGVLLFVTDGLLELVGTDNYRLTRTRLQTKVCSAEAFSVLLPYNSANQIHKYLLCKADETKMVADDKCVVFTCWPFSYTVLLQDNAFPDHVKIVPKEYQNVVEVQRRDFIGALKRIEAVSDNDDKRFEMSCSDNRLVFTTCQNDSARAKISLDVQHKGEPFCVVLVPLRLLDMLACLKSDTVRIGYQGVGKPIGLWGESMDNYLSLVMPLP